MTRLQSFPGAVGLFLRSKLYPHFLGRSGRSVFVGRNVTFVGAKRIELGSRIIIDDNAVLDACKGRDCFIRCGDEVEVSRNAILACKASGSITLGNFVSIGPNVLVSAVSSVKVGDGCAIGPYATILASGHDWSDSKTPALPQRRAIGDIVIEDNVWVGAHVTVMDGVTIGANSVIAVGSVVSQDIPPYTIAAGAPARVVRTRKKD